MALRNLIYKQVTIHSELENKDLNIIQPSEETLIHGSCCLLFIYVLLIRVNNQHLKHLIICRFSLLINKWEFSMLSFLIMTKRNNMFV